MINQHTEYNNKIYAQPPLGPSRSPQSLVRYKWFLPIDTPRCHLVQAKVCDLYYNSLVPSGWGADSLMSGQLFVTPEVDGKVRATSAPYGSLGCEESKEGHQHLQRLRVSASGESTREGYIVSPVL